ncbi:MAG: type II secretion system protein [bacterium]
MGIIIKNLRKNNGGFGLTGVIVSLVIISVMIAEALPYLSGYYGLKQAKSAINAANGIINAEIQYQQASYSNYAEKNSAPSGGDYFGTVSQMIGGMNILPANNLQQFLPQGISLSVVNYQGNDNCVEKRLGGNTITECLEDEGSGQFKLLTNGLDSPNLSPYITMFENGIKGGVSGYSGGVLTTQVSVPFGFSAYPKIQNGGGNTAAATAASGGGGGGYTPPVQCTEFGGGGNCEQYTFSNGAQTSNLNGYYSHPGSVCIETQGGNCIAWSQ